MVTARPTLSVLLPTRNRLPYLAQAIESVRSQALDNLQIVVSDNYSTEPIGEYVAGLGDDRVVYARTDSFVPVTANWNNALQYATGEYIVMLGDDDALAPGYSEALCENIMRFDRPDVIYSSAWRFAYPGVMPSEPRGYLQQWATAGFFEGLADARLLTGDESEELVRASLDLRVTYDFNMQYATFNRRMVERVRTEGLFFRSPYPDFFAMNALMLLASSVVVEPRRLVLIGITPRSHGYYFYNGRGDDGVAMLGNMTEQDVPPQDTPALVPGNVMYTCWYLAMAQLTRSHAAGFGLQANTRRYRRLQYATALFGWVLGRTLSRQDLREVLRTMTVPERMSLVPVGLALAAVARCGGRFGRYRVGRLLNTRLFQHPLLEPEKEVYGHADITGALSALRSQSLPTVQRSPK